jgi:aryl-alcohol dehydrogenase-like predicted oxidoreductase
MNDFLERRPIGNTGLTTGRIGIGSTFNAPARVIEDAFHRGVNYLYWGTVRQPDFARAMVNLSKQPRDELILTIQSYSNDPATIEGEVEEALKASGGLESFDFLLLGNRMEAPTDDYFEVFERLKARGKVRFLSLSSHNRPLLPKLMAQYERGETPIELLMFRYNAVHRGAEKDVFPFVPAKRPGLTTYTATRWGHLLDPTKMPEGEQPLLARDCYRFSLGHPAVDFVTCGPANAEQMDEALAALETGPLQPDERERIERIGAHIYGQYAPAYPDAGDAEDVSSGRAAQ